MQSTNSEYGLAYLTTCNVTFTVKQHGEDLKQNLNKESQSVVESTSVNKHVEQCECMHDHGL